MPILPDTNASSAETDVTHLLLVEDDPAYAELVRESLRDERAQFETQLADDLAGALQLLAERRFDAVLLDLSLPDSQGLETVSRVVEAYPNVPIVVLTGLHDDAVGLEAVHAGAQDYLVKGDGGGPLILRALRYAMERKHTETALRHARDELERRVEERTAGLREANERLQRESDQRREAETNLRRNHDFIAAVLETIGALVIVVDREGRIRSFNRACEQVTGYTADEVVGADFRKLLVPEDESYELSEVFAHGDEREPARFESSLVARSGERRLISWSNTLSRENGTGLRLIATGIDITERRRIEDRERQRILQIAHSLRLSTMGEMATQLAHELNQPLAAVVTYCQACRRLLADQPSVPPEVTAALEAVSTQAMRAADVIRELRSFLLKDAGEHSDIDINTLVQETIKLISAEARSQHTDIRLKLADELPPLLGNRVLLEQVLLNLVRNAIEAMADADTERRQVTISSGVNDRSEVVVTVRDTGPGLPSEAQSEAFEPFYTTKADGMGMGLAISQSIVRTHGGRLRAMDDRTTGAVFELTLPPAEARASGQGRHVARRRRSTG